MKIDGHCSVLVIQPTSEIAEYVATRIAAERNEPLGISVGYCTRFKSKMPRAYNSIHVCSDDAVLRMLKNGLKGVSHIIVDEFQERSMTTDYLLIVLRDMIREFASLRLIVISANVNCIYRLATFFDYCPLVEIPRRIRFIEQHFLEDCLELTGYSPTEDDLYVMRHQPDTRMEFDIIDETCNVSTESRYCQKTKINLAILPESSVNFVLIEALLLHVIRHAETDQMVNALIFLPGHNAMHELYARLRDHNEFSKPQYMICLCSNEMSVAQLTEAFQPVPMDTYKIVLATEIAETMLSIPHITCVIDTCKTGVKWFRKRDKCEGRPAFWASRQNLEQSTHFYIQFQIYYALSVRTNIFNGCFLSLSLFLWIGKQCAGRHSIGNYFVLCSKKRYEMLSPQTEPDMRRLPNIELALNIMHLGLGDIKTYLQKALDPPTIKSISYAKTLLRDIKCMDDSNHITALGRVAASLPIGEKNSFKSIYHNEVIKIEKQIPFPLFRPAADKNDFVRRSFRYWILDG